MLNSTNKLRQVMLIDDSAIDLKIHSKILSLHYPGLEIITCLSGAEALGILKKNKDLPKELPDLILLDIQMPEMDGFEFLNKFTKLPPVVIDKCAVVMLSSTLDYGDIIRAQANRHVIKLLKKPLNPLDLKRITG
ncbi:response regulator [Pedobacter sp.]|uniref:response regulator n=1 Tax=Pedobacter sp. TaxID=1411316 RepID=UPI003D7F7B47